MLALREKVVKHQINHHAGHRDVHPKRPGPAGDFFVQFETLLHGAVQRDEHQRHDEEGQNNMGYENGEIHRPNPALSRKFRHGFDGQMIRQIAGQKNRGGHEGGNHAVAVGHFVLPTDEIIAGCQKDGAQSVEAGVDGGEVRERHGEEIKSSQREASFVFVFRIPNSII